MQFSTILIATAALAMTVIAAPIAGDEHGSTNIENSGNDHSTKTGDIKQSGNHNYCSNQMDGTTQVCCNKSAKSEASGLIATNLLANTDIVSDACFIANKCEASQNAYCCKQENKSNGINLIQWNSCGPVVEM
ncbi:hypothetical protein P167DRAFT_568710 [Morchella conica CCBAS932]|uniref:Hydrophobin n=1 Tax=Morchella conica CCBAS932 TaxID=1392247 RepID=A0A3N4K9X5_9PEZI|nr:hypothetical protein P167DRAFT_568710 [Morchella conica CCBAS932]